MGVVVFVLFLFLNGPPKVICFEDLDPQHAFFNDLDPQHVALSLVKGGSLKRDTPELVQVGTLFGLGEKPKRTPSAL